MKIAVATTQYWPVPGIRQIAVKRFVDRLSDCGADVTVLTESLGDHWPNKLRIRDHQVVRLGNGGWNLFGQAAIGKKISEWLKTNSKLWDCLIVCGDIEGAKHLFYRCFLENRPSFCWLYSQSTFEYLFREKPSALKRELWFQNIRFFSQFPNTVQSPQILEDSPKDSLLKVASGGDSNRQSFRVHRLPVFLDPAEKIPFGSITRSASSLTVTQRQSYRKQLRSSFATGNRPSETFMVAIFVFDDQPQCTEWVNQVIEGLISESQKQGDPKQNLEFWIVGDNHQLRGYCSHIDGSQVYKRAVFLGEVLEYGDLLAATDLVVLPPSDVPSGSEVILQAVESSVPFLVHSDELGLQDLFPLESSKCWEQVLDGAIVKESSANTWVTAIQSAVKNVFLFKDRLKKLHSAVKSIQSEKDSLLSHLLKWSGRGKEGLSQ